jgi:hypothetical protein
VQIRKWLAALRDTLHGKDDFASLGNGPMYIFGQRNEIGLAAVYLSWTGRYRCLVRTRRPMSGLDVRIGRM